VRTPRPGRDPDSPGQNYPDLDIAGLDIAAAADFAAAGIGAADIEAAGMVAPGQRTVAAVVAGGTAAAPGQHNSAVPKIVLEVPVPERNTPARVAAAPRCR
jgi:hypothetical protein